MHVDDLMGDLPVNSVDLRLRFQIEQTEIECLLRFLFDLFNVVQALEAISALSTAVSRRGCRPRVCDPFRRLRP